MRSIVDLLRRDRAARRFFLAYGQSSLGTGAGYVALLLVAYQRFHSPWAIALVLLADFMPPTCAITADVARAAAFVGLALIPSFPVTVALALLAGSATALSKPALLAGLPEVVERGRLSQATALFGALTEVGYTVGPGIAALTFIVTGPKALLLADAATFGLSALILSTLSFGLSKEARAKALEDRGSLLREASRQNLWRSSATNGSVMDLAKITRCRACCAENVLFKFSTCLRPSFTGREIQQRSRPSN